MRGFKHIQWLHDEQWPPTGSASWTVTMKRFLRFAILFPQHCRRGLQVLAFDRRISHYISKFSIKPQNTQALARNDDEQGGSLLNSPAKFSLIGHARYSIWILSFTSALSCARENTRAPISRIRFQRLFCVRRLVYSRFFMQHFAGRAWLFSCFIFGLSNNAITFQAVFSAFTSLAIYCIAFHHNPRTYLIVYKCL